VRSASCEITIPELELTLPATNRGQLTTVEGLIRDIYADLSTDQPLRRIQDEDSYNKIQALLDKMKPILGDNDDEEQEGDIKPSASELDIPMPAFTVKLNDPAGNSFIEFIGSMADPKWNLRTYPRTLEQNIALGLVAPDDSEEKTDDAATKPITDDEIFTFKGVCSSCGRPIETHMKKVNIPYFKVRKSKFFSHEPNLTVSIRIS